MIPVTPSAASLAVCGSVCPKPYGFQPNFVGRSCLLSVDDRLGGVVDPVLVHLLLLAFGVAGDAAVDDDHLLYAGRPLVGSHGLRELVHLVRIDQPGLFAVASAVLVRSDIYGAHALGV